MAMTKVERRGGARPGAGRPKGSKNRKPILFPNGVNPVEVLESIAGDPSQPATARVAAAKALMDRRSAPEQAEGSTAPQKHELVWHKREGLA